MVSRDAPAERWSGENAARSLRAAFERRSRRADDVNEKRARRFHRDPSRLLLPPPGFAGRIAGKRGVTAGNVLWEAGCRWAASASDAAASGSHPPLTHIFPELLAIHPRHMTISTKSCRPSFGEWTATSTMPGRSCEHLPQRRGAGQRSEVVSLPPVLPRHVADALVLLPWEPGLLSRGRHLHPRLSLSACGANC